MLGLDRYAAQMHSLLRIMTGLMFLEHGTAKLLHFPHVPQFDQPLTPILIVAGVIELVGGALVAVGYATRLAAFICSGEMAVAYFLFHVRMGRSILPVMNQGDAAVLYCFIFLFIAAAGAGPWSLDAVFGRKKTLP